MDQASLFCILQSKAFLIGPLRFDRVTSYCYQGLGQFHANSGSKLKFKFQFSSLLIWEIVISVYLLNWIWNGIDPPPNPVFYSTSRWRSLNSGPSVFSWRWWCAGWSWPKERTRWTTETTMATSAWSWLDRWMNTSRSSVSSTVALSEAPVSLYPNITSVLLTPYATLNNQKYAK